MNETNTPPKMSTDDRLKAILYQFIQLYERWSEDRQVAAKQGADTAQLVAIFTQQVKKFKDLEPEVRKELIFNIEDAIRNAAGSMSRSLGEQALNATKDASIQLSNTVSRAKETLESYRIEFKYTHWKIIAASCLTTVATCALLVWLVIPKPISPMTDEQFSTYLNGIEYQGFWPKLNHKQQAWLTHLGWGTVKNHGEPLECLREKTT